MMMSKQSSVAWREKPVGESYARNCGTSQDGQAEANNGPSTSTLAYAWSPFGRHSAQRHQYAGLMHHASYNTAIS